PLGQPDRAVALRREIALQADDVRIERAAKRESLLFTLDAEIEDSALVALLLEARRDADRPEGLDERQHFETEDAADWGLEERDFQRCREPYRNSGNFATLRSYWTPPRRSR